MSYGTLVVMSDQHVHYIRPDRHIRHIGCIEKPTLAYRIWLDHIIHLCVPTNVNIEEHTTPVCTYLCYHAVPAYMAVPDRRGGYMHVRGLFGLFRSYNRLCLLNMRRSNTSEERTAYTGSVKGSWILQYLPNTQKDWIWRLVKHRHLSILTRYRQ